MDHIRNGMSSLALGCEGWHKPWSGTNGGACVEMKRLDDGRVAVRQSTDPEGPALIWTNRAIRQFILGAKAGAADYLVDELRADGPGVEGRRMDSPHTESFRMEGVA